MKKHKKSLFIVLMFLLFILFLSSCTNKTDEYIDVRGKEFAGSVSCAQCHQNIYDSAIQSAHYNATTMATKENIHGNFNREKNTFVYDQDTKLVMEDRNDGLYQVLYKNDNEVKAYRFDISFGTKNAQTWLFWEGDKSYELPISYYTSVNDWATSPGFSPREPFFKRLVEKDCFACHSSNISSKQDKETSESMSFGSTEVGEVMDKESIVFGIDCERCHGPAAKHVNYHLKYPKIRTAKYIVTFNSLNKQQKLDMCAICHLGNNSVRIKSRFKFRPGDKLSDFQMNLYTNNSPDSPDVHGNQVGSISLSKCFIESKKMDCISCHDPHKNASKSLVSYSQICMSCHSEAKNNFCIIKVSSGISLKDNCIDCHMPKKASGAISFRLSRKSENSSYILRTHRIGIYPSETQVKVSGK